MASLSEESGWGWGGELLLAGSGADGSCVGVEVEGEPETGCGEEELGPPTTPGTPPPAPPTRAWPLSLSLSLGRAFPGNSPALAARRRLGSNAGVRIWVLMVWWRNLENGLLIN